MLRLFSKTSLLRVQHHKLFCEYDSLLGWRKIPGVKGIHKTAEYSIPEVINSKGIRGPEYSYDKDNEEYRILVVGDSFVEGYTVEFNEMFSEIVKMMLNKRGDRNYEVISAGTGGYCTDQEFLFFKEEGKKYNPDLTVLMFCDNDIIYNAKSKYDQDYKPLFKLEEGKLRLTNVPVPPREKREKKFIETVKRILREKTYLYNFITDRVKSFRGLHAIAIKLGLAQETNTLITDLKVNRHKEVWIPCEFRPYKKKCYDEEIDRAWQITEALLSDFKKEVTFIGGNLLVFHIPSRAAVYPEEWEAMKKRYCLSKDDWDIDNIGRKLADICNKQGIDFIEPTKLFKAEADKLNKQGQRLYFFFDGHWNVKGHQLVGQILMEYMNSHYLKESI